MRARRTACVAAWGFLLGIDITACSRPAHRTTTAADSPRSEVPAATVSRSHVRGDGAPLLRSDVERDLSLEMVRGSGPVEIGHEADTKVMLVNRSTSRSYPVVLSSDGSDEPGWREPHIWYTVERRTNSSPWQPAEYTAKRICGNFDENWESDIVELRPGQRIELPWFEFRPGFWKLDDATAIRLIAHYSYGEHVKDPSKVPAALHGMPEYALASAPLELPIDAPIVLELRVLGPIPRRPGLPLAPVFDVVAVNQWKGALPFSTLDAGGARLSFRIEYEEKPGHVEQAYFETEPGDSHAARDQIARGERRTVVTATTRTNENWELSPRTRFRRVRAVLSVYGHADERSVFSPWVDVPAH